MMIVMGARGNELSSCKIFELNKLKNKKSCQTFTTLNTWLKKILDKKQYTGISIQDDYISHIDYAHSTNSS